MSLRAAMNYGLLEGVGEVDGLGAGACVGAGTGVPGGVPTADPAPGAWSDGGEFGVVVEGFATGFGVGMVRLGFCLSGSTSGPFWPHANTSEVRQTIVNRRIPFMAASIPARRPPGFGRNFSERVPV